MKKLTTFQKAISALLLIAVISWIVWGNTALQLNTYTILSDRLPKAFNGYRIAHISDLHNAEMGKDNGNLLVMLKEAKPDIIAITGDFIDSRNTDIEIALQFAEKAAHIAPCYYVTGNHEAIVPEYDEFRSGLTKLGIVVLEDERIDLKMNDETITLIGVNDPSFKFDDFFDDAELVMKNQLRELVKKDDGFTLLLSHRPELFDLYVDSGIDLVLSGHTHGGQFRLPFVGALVAPNQGLFPKYDAGLYSAESTNMIVSRGIGNSIIPFRINNRPEVILIELKSDVSKGE
ncbi:MAG: metallophosphoesterase [Clostridia bacterium]|nr:metallophosphoesterase [Clostridia bacterium]MBP6161853.1 metallophosphoesterase [Clostridia bacterium]MBP6949873.1 metallophosphoesterase [Clostridia bacterium]HHU98032.1 metallophosphoesterase [Petrimonas sp.]